MVNVADSNVSGGLRTVIVISSCLEPGMIPLEGFCLLATGLLSCTLLNSLFSYRRVFVFVGDLGSST